MIITQAEITKTVHYDSICEIDSQKREQGWIKSYAEGENFKTLEEMFERAIMDSDPDSEIRTVKTEFHELELFVLSATDKRIDLHIKLNPGEKAILYGTENGEHPFWNEVMLLLLLDSSGKLEKKFFFNDEYYYLFRHLPENKEWYESEKKAGDLSDEELEEESYVKAIRLAEEIEKMTDINNPSVHVIIQDNN